MKNLMLASTSTVHGSGFLDYIKPDLVHHFSNSQEIIFIPYARPGGISHNSYTEKVKEAFYDIGKVVRGLHEFDDPKLALTKAKGIFTGGGNTFVLLNELYQLDLVDHLRTVLESGTPYLGTSAGTNICGQSIRTTNDMPIVYPPSFEALKLVPFNINPHYLDPDPESTHMGETREMRITEFHHHNETPVVGLREGSYLKVDNDVVTLQGDLSARVFLFNKIPEEIPSGSTLSY